MGSGNEFVAASQTFGIGDKEYTLSPITIRGFIELEKVLKEEPLTSARVMVQGIEPELAKWVIKEAKKESDAIRFGTLEFDKRVETVFGLTYLLYLSLRKEHKVTLGEAADILHEAADKRTELANLVYSMAGYTPLDPTKATGESDPSPEPTP